MKLSSKNSLCIMIAILLGLSGCDRSVEPRQVDFDEISENVTSVVTAESFDEMAKAVDKHNSIATSGNDIEILNKRAESPDSIDFMRLTAEQNNFSVLSKEWRTKNRDDMIYLQNFDWENSTSEEFDLLISRLPKICSQLEINNSYLDKVIDILDHKIKLAKIDSVIEEIFLGDEVSYLQLLETMRKSQVNLLDQEKIGFKNLGCDDLSR